MTDIDEYATKAKWKWEGHTVHVNDHRWTIRSTEWHITMGVRSAGRPKHHWRDDIVGQQSNMNKDSKGLRKLENSSGVLLLAVED